MERKTGEIFEYNGEWYQCVEGLYCDNCAFVNDNCEDRERITLREKLTKQPTTGFCNSEKRNDRKSVIFKKLEKVGEPYAEGNSIVSERMFQKYRTYEKNFFLNERDLLFTSYGDIVSIEIKQNQEVMEEKKLNLKEFDLEAAKQGKPVCTREGRKARIICFDLQDPEYDIVALLLGKNGFESICTFNSNGRFNDADGVDKQSKHDLMMLPEKKEGWVNVYKERVYKSKEEAVGKKYDGCTYIDTIKVEWEE